MNSSLDWLIYPQDSQELDPEKMTYETTNHQQRPKSVAVINSGAKEWFEVHTRMGTEKCAHLSQIKHAGMAHWYNQIHSCVLFGSYCVCWFFYLHLSQIFKNSGDAI